MLDKCTNCVCDLGYIKCKKLECPWLDCDVKEFLEGECCSVCTGQCVGMLSSNKYYEPNDIWSEENDNCIKCQCVNGNSIVKIFKNIILKIS